MLEVMCVDDVEYPVETQYGINDHCAVIPPCVLVATHVAQEPNFGVGLAQRPVHAEIPDGDVDSIDSSEGDENGK